MIVDNPNCLNTTNQENETLIATNQEDIDPVY